MIDVLKQNPLNFNNDVTRRLDTGGRNWKCLYKKLNPSQLRFATCKNVAITDPKDDTFQAVSVVDNKWIHLCGAGYSEKFNSKFEFFKNIAKVTDEGATLKDLVLGK